MIHALAALSCTMPALLRQEIFLVLAAIAAAIGFPLEHAILDAGQAPSMVAAVALIVAILLASVRVAHHAFSYSYAQHAKLHPNPAPVPTRARASRNLATPIGFMAGGIALIGVLSKVMSRTLDAGLTGSGVPPIVAPLLVATLSASPEILTAMRAALAKRMQPVVNIALGASLSTVSSRCRSSRRWPSSPDSRSTWRCHRRRR